MLSLGNKSSRDKKLNYKYKTVEIKELLRQAKEYNLDRLFIRNIKRSYPRATNYLWDPSDRLANPPLPPTESWYPSETTIGTQISLRGLTPSHKLIISGNIHLQLCWLSDMIDIIEKKKREEYENYLLSR